jgi:cysteine desulfurase
MPPVPTSSGPATATPDRDPTPPRGYLDAASTEPLHPAARAAWLSAVEDGWADPARLYGAARRARLLLDTARETVAGVLGCRADEVSFTGSGTAAAHLAVAGLALGRRRSGSRAVTSAVEHSSVLHALEQSAAGADTTVVGVDPAGVVDVAAMADALTTDTKFACLQTANQEVGSVQPVSTVAQACAERGVPLLVDAAQSVGRGPLPDGWSVLVASAHKWGGPPGVGVLAVRTGVRWRRPVPADDRSSDPRVPGFENVPGVVAAAAALAAVAAEAVRESERLRALTDRIRDEVPRRVPDTVVHGHPVARLPHLVAFSFVYANGEALLGELDVAGFAAASGSACAASSLEPSHVLAAMGVLTHGNLRVSLPRAVEGDDVERFLDVLPGAVERARAGAGLGGG